jgi:hypothetical protein
VPQVPWFGGVFGGVGWLWGWICGLVWGRVLFSESPPLMRRDCGQPPFSYGLEYGALLGVPVVGGGDFPPMDVLEYGFALGWGIG